MGKYADYLMGAAGAITALGAALSQAASPEISKVRSWGYFLSDIVPEAVQRSPYELMVIDPTQSGEDSSRFRPKQVAEMQRMPDGNRRLLIAYLSIGEAEVYRGYWKRNWKPGAPPWLDEENPVWPGNFKVRYWDPGWQALMFGNSKAALDQILSAGFDGAYLDLIDAFEHYEDQRSNAAAEMVDLVTRIRSYARKQNPDFVIIGQNAERLIAQPAYLRAIDAVAKEDLSYGQIREEEPTPAADHAESLRYLRTAKREGKPIFTVDYTDRSDQRQTVLTLAEQEGFIPHFANRELDRLTMPDGTAPDPKLDRSRMTLFNAATLPQGQWRLALRSQWETSRFEYDFEDESTGKTQTFVAEEFGEHTTAVDLTYGVTSRLEMGLSIPYVSGHFQPDKRDRTGQFANEVNESGIGNLRLLSRWGTQWNEERDFILFSGEWGIPTDSRNPDLFGGFTDFFFDATYEHYWDRFGITCGGGLDIFANDSFGEVESSFSWRVGALANVTDIVFASLTVGGREGGSTQVEASVDIRILANASLEIFAGKDVSGPEKATLAGISLTFLF